MFKQNKIPIKIQKIKTNPIKKFNLISFALKIDNVKGIQIKDTPEIIKFIKFNPS